MDTPRSSRGQKGLTGIFRDHAEGFRESLRAVGYSRSSVKAKVLVLAEINRWLTRRRVEPTAFQETDVDEFLADSHRGYKGIGGIRMTAMQVLAYLRARGALIPAPVLPSAPPRFHEAAFETYLRRERGMAEGSIGLYMRLVRLFILARGYDRRHGFRRPKAIDVTRFMMRSAHTSSVVTARLTATALRSFLRFLYLRGETPVDLAPAVPTVARWRLASLPRFTPAKDVQTLLRACDRRTSSGRRDYAVMLLLARLGLRSAEVAKMTLDDIDWQLGELTVRGKGPRLDRVPLPSDVGHALAEYIRRDRPRNDCRHVFLGAYALHLGFRQCAVPSIVRRVIRRAGIRTPSTGAHLLRHSLATDILRRGGSLAEVRDLLRHRHLETTAIYAKVDVSALRSIAPRWPGREP